MRIGPHEWVGSGYHCEACHSSYHCAACGDGSGSQGHSMMDDDGHFFSCQDRERADRWRTELFRSKS